MTDDHATCEYSGLRSLASLLQEQEEREAQRTQATPTFSAEDRDRIIQMAWEDRTPFEASPSIPAAGEGCGRFHARTSPSQQLPPLAPPHERAHHQTCGTARGHRVPVQEQRTAGVIG